MLILLERRNSLEYLKLLPKIDGFQKEALSFAISSISLKSCDWAEFGTSYGNNSTPHIYSLLPDKVKLHIFDSFKGLPEDWIGLNGSIVPKGKHACDIAQWMIDAPNITIHEGWYEDTLPEFAETQKKKLSLINIDCDLYKSTKTIFDNIDHLISKGTIIHFDEFYNFGSWERHEFKAFMEYTTDYDRDFKYLGRTNHQQVWLKITK